MANVEKISDQEIEKFHSQLIEAFSTCLQLELQIEQVDKQLNWKAALPGISVLYTAKSASRKTIVNFQDGQQMFSFSEPDRMAPLWVYWGEKWKKTQVVQSRKTAAATLDLVGVKLCFHVGNFGQKKTQILRAEWDNPKLQGNEVAQVAQPHWHIDPNLMDIPSNGCDNPVPVSGGLVELPATQEGLAFSAPNSLSLQRLHLGMAGWRNQETHPQCWQHKLDLDAIAEWLKRVLVYCKSELPNITIR
jgi:hypothetical protein